MKKLLIIVGFILSFMTILGSLTGAEGMNIEDIDIESIINVNVIFNSGIQK